MVVETARETSELNVLNYLNYSSCSITENPDDEGIFTNEELIQLLLPNDMDVEKSGENSEWNVWNNADGLSDSSSSVSENPNEEGTTTNEECTQALLPNNMDVEKAGETRESNDWKDSKDSTTDNHDEGAKTKKDSQILEKAETQAVSGLRLLVIIVLVISTMAVSVGVNFYLRDSEKDQFIESFVIDADKVVGTIAQSLSIMLETADTLAVNIVSQASVAGMKWPFVTIAHSSFHLIKALKQAPALYMEVFHYVAPEERERWENYTANNNLWVAETLEVQRNDETYFGSTPNYTDLRHYDFIRDNAFQSVPNSPRGYLPAWQSAPVTATRGPYNFDYWARFNTEAVDIMLNEKKAVLSEAINLPDPNNKEEVESTARSIKYWYSTFVGPEQDPSEPVTGIFYPILATSIEEIRAERDESGRVVAGIANKFYWTSALRNVLLQGKRGLVVVFTNPCNPSFTYRIDGPNSTFLGRGDHHDKAYDNMKVTYVLTDTPWYQIFNKTYTGASLSTEFCPYTINLYPSQDMEDLYTTNNPLIITIIAAFVFSFTSGTFLVYDFLVERRQRKVMTSAARSKAIVSSLFPSNVHDRLYQEADDHQALLELEAPNRMKLRSFLHGEKQGVLEDDKRDGINMYKNKPIADLFLECTVLFADIANFTAWSSTREPAQVFILLETIYLSFDEIAKRRRVYKVETVGDCYVAVAGVPDPRKDHAVAMARFARECLSRMSVLTEKLEEVLGPDTADLSMRFGLHSGPVTAGILRGERSRFQLFGDTMNTASHMESTGQCNRIQLTEATADLLSKAGKENWCRPRDDKVFIKDKGEMQTFWLTSHDGAISEASSGISQNLDVPGCGEVSKHLRLIRWMVDVLAAQLKQIKAKRVSKQGFKKPKIASLPPFNRKPDVLVLEEVKEIIPMPQFDATEVTCDWQDILLDEMVEEQLTAYVTAVASTYRNNPFHNFEHASHVTMSVVKLLSRIVAPDLTNESCMADDVASRLHDHTYGIASDPLTQFACAFSALIHDADHSGVPNTQVIKENPTLAAAYKCRSIAEQHSVDIAWELLMQDKFKDLRFAIYGSDIDAQSRFRSLVVNSVMATNIMDKELIALRNKRWDKAFKEDLKGENVKDTNDRKATIVIEHLIQASDVAHTMQHWHVYRKWNELLFCELYCAYKEGRAEKNPAKFWYKDEIGFFDFYIIPLAQKLKDCGVFGISSAEYLNYAMQNRHEWELYGQQAVEQMIHNLKQKEVDVEGPIVVL